MNITGKNLEFLSEALGYALEGIQGRIGSCPDVIEYEEELDELKELKAKVAKFKERADKAIAEKDNPARHLNPTAGDMQL